LQSQKVAGHHAGKPYTCKVAEDWLNGPDGTTDCGTARSWWSRQCCSVQTPTHVITLAGCGRQIRRHREHCTSTTGRLSVRCCKKNESRQKVAMRLYGCNRNQPFSAAARICEAKGLQICSKQQIQTNSQCGSGSCARAICPIWSRC